VYSRSLARLATSTCASLIACLCVAPALAQTATTSIVYSFNSDLQLPISPLIQASDGHYYGVAISGAIAAEQIGGIYRITPGAQNPYSLVHAFNSDTSEGSPAQAALVEGPDGNLYGVTQAGGGPNNNGTFYKVNPLTNAFTVLYSFVSEASSTFGAPILGSDGNFYIASAYGGSHANGSIVQITPSGTATLLYSFAGPEGENPLDSLLETSPGTFYGTAQYGGANSNGSIFKVVVTTTGGVSSAAVTDVYDFNDADDNEASPFTEAPNGSLYTVSDPNGDSTYGAVLAFNPANSTLSAPFTFTANNSVTYGFYPSAPLFLGSDNNFYTATSESSFAENGDVLRITPAGVVTTLFDGSNEQNNELQAASTGVIQGSDGNLYLQSPQGGANNKGDIVETKFTTALAGPVTLSFANSTVAAGTADKLSFTVANGYSTTLKQCYAFFQGNGTGGGNWSGLQAGTGGANGVTYTGSAMITPTVAGTYNYALTCGGNESGFATLTVTGGSSGAATTTTVAISPGTIYSDGGFEISANTSTANGPVNTTDTVTVTIYDGTSVLYTATLTPDSYGNVTKYVPSAALPGPGTYTVKAVFSGDPSTYRTSTGTATLVILAAPTYSAPVNIHSFPQGRATEFFEAPFIQANDLNIYGAIGLNTGGHSGAFFSLSPAGTYKETDFATATHFDLEVSGINEAADGYFFGESITSAAPSTVSLVAITSAAQLYTAVGPPNSFSGEPVVIGTDGRYYASAINAGSTFLYAVDPTTLKPTTLTNFGSTDWTIAALLEVTPGLFYVDAERVTNGTEVEELIYTTTAAGSYNKLQDLTSNFPNLKDFVVGPDSRLYAIASNGVVRVNPDGSTTLINANSGETEVPGDLYLGSDGSFYANTKINSQVFGFINDGGVARIALDGTATLIVPSGTSYLAATQLLQTNNGTLYHALSQPGGDSPADDGHIEAIPASPALPAPITLSLNTSTLVLGGPVTLTWQVRNAFSATAQVCNGFASAGGGTFTGRQPGTLANGMYSGSTSVTPSAAGTIIYSLTCGGMESAAVSLTVTKGTASVAPSASPNPVVAGQPLTLSATVTAANSHPTGTVTFFYGTEQIGSPITLNSNGVATLANVGTSGLPAGKYNLTAKYSGDSSYVAGSAGFTLTVVVKTNPVLTVTATPNPVTRGQNVTLTFTLKTSGGTGIPNALITLMSGQTALGSVKTNASGVAPLVASTATYPGGAYALTANYAGSSAYSPVTKPFSLTIQNPTLVNFSVTPTTVKAGSNVTITASISNGANSSPATGTVALNFAFTSTGGGANVGNLPALVGGSTSASFSTTGYPAGTYYVEGIYSGDAYNLPSTSSPRVVVTITN
jgi:uncharacterized repeat protein (TIGR03803 family)